MTNIKLQLVQNQLYKEIIKIHQQLIKFTIKFYINLIFINQVLDIKIDRDISNIINEDDNEVKKEDNNIGKNNFKEYK